MGEFSASIVEEMPRLRRYAAILSKDRSQVEDLVQETLARALAKSHTFEPGTNLRAWLFTIMHNQHVNLTRRKSRLGAPLAPQEIDEKLSINAPQMWGLHMRDLDRALAQLPEEQRQVVVLAGAHSMSYEDIAETTNIPIGTVRSRLSRGRDQLRALMAGEIPEHSKAPRGRHSERQAFAGL